MPVSQAAVLDSTATSVAVISSSLLTRNFCDREGIMEGKVALITGKLTSYNSILVIFNKNLLK